MASLAAWRGRQPDDYRPLAVSSNQPPVIVSQLGAHPRPGRQSAGAQSGDRIDSIHHRDARGADGLRGQRHSTLEADGGNGARHVILPIEYPLLALGTWVGPNLDGLPSPAADGDDYSTSVNLGTLGSAGGVRQGPAGPARILLPAAAGLDGQQIVVADLNHQPVTPLIFELDTNGSFVPAPNKVVVSLLPADTAPVVAQKLVDAVWQTIFDGRLEGLVPVADGGQVSFAERLSMWSNCLLLPASAEYPAATSTWLCLPICRVWPMVRR